VQEGKLGLPDEEEQRKMFLYCSDFLTQRGYCHYEISNFAKDGFECFHNKGYWNGCDYLGLGPSAVSTLSGRRWQNPCDLREYEQRVHGGNLWEQGQRLTLQERDREQVMLKMRTYHGISLEEYAYLTLRHMDRSCVPCLETFLQEDLMHCDNGFLRLTPRGMLVSNEILARMLF
jgi:oxygen-independent coproporphyrinogen-3 oxidase